MCSPICGSKVVEKQKVGSLQVVEYLLHNGLSGARSVYFYTLSSLLILFLLFVYLLCFICCQVVLLATITCCFYIVFMFLY